MIYEFIKDIKENKNIDQNLFFINLQIFCRNICKKIISNDLNISDEEIEDIVQDTIVKLWEDNFKIIKGINDPLKAPSYIVKMLKNKIFSILKEKDNFEKISDIDGNEDNDLKNAKKNKEQNKYIFKGDHTDYLVAEEILFILNQFFKDITGKKEKIIFLKKLQSIKSKDIAKELGLSETNVNTIFSRLNKKLVRLLKKNNLINIENCEKNDEISKIIYDWLLSILDMTEEEKSFN